jgi:hypothetical protein
MGSSKACPTATHFLGTTDGAPHTKSTLEEESLIDGSEEIMEERYVILVAADEPDATESTRSPGWLVPELVDARWTLTEDTPDSRTWAGVIDGDSYARFAEGWGLENKPGEANLGMPGEHGHLASYSYTFDGLEWESGGYSPIVWMRLTVSEPVKAPRRPHDPVTPTRALPRARGRLSYGRSRP